MIDRLQFTIRNAAPTQAPPRVPYVWYHKISETEGDYYLATGTGDVEDWVRISIDANHPTRTDNPHNVTPAQLGNNIAQWNADRIKGAAISDMALEDKFVMEWNAANNRWEYALLGLAYTNYFATQQKYILDIFASPIGDAEFLYSGFVDDQIYIQIRPSVKNTAQWNANAIQGAAVTLTDEGESAALIYDPTSDNINTVPLSQLTARAIYHAWQPQELTTTSQTGVELIPTSGFDHDNTGSQDPNGIFDDFTIGGWVVVTQDAKIRFDFSASLQNTTTSDGTARAFLLLGDYDEELDVVNSSPIAYAEAIATNANTSNRYQTVSKSGIIDVTAGQLLSLRFANNLAVSNNIVVKNGSAVLILEKVG
jgi:hypothetical protein